MRLPLTRHAMTLAALLSASSAAAQQIAARACASGAVVADLGYDGTSCVNCTVYNGSIEYLTEPSISQIREGGPAEGKLRENDVLVAVDGSLITTRAAWRKMRALSPGDPVTLTVRRNGIEREVTITPDSRCASTTESSVADDTRSRDDKWDKVRDDKSDKIREKDLDKIRDEKSDKVRDDRSEDPLIVIDGKVQSGQTVFRASPFSGKGLGFPNAASNSRAIDGTMGQRGAPAGWIGIGLECAKCTPVGQSGGRYRWRFEDPPSIVEVVPGGPAARAGLKSGDLILQIDGASVTSVAGGRRWGDIRPGDDVSLTIRRGLQRRTITVQAEDRPSMPGSIEGRAPQMGFGQRPSLGPTRAQQQSFSDPADSDRYYVGGAMVDVKGRATSVQFDRSTGELVIVGPDFTVRVRPREDR